MEAWDPGGVRVLLANPGGRGGSVSSWSCRDGGGAMTDGTDEGGARAARMDEWVVWEAEEPTGLICLPFLFSFVKGARDLRTAYPRVVDLLCLSYI
jgi:hypothetical protein